MDSQGRDNVDVQYTSATPLHAVSRVLFTSASTTIVSALSHRKKCPNRPQYNVVFILIYRNVIN